MRITQDLPMGFEYDNHVRKVVDRKSAPKKIWTLSAAGSASNHFNQPLSSLGRIVSDN
jgi:hypothetical protein